MNMKRTFLTGLIATMLAVAGSAAWGVGPGVIQLYQYPTQLPDDNWEYIYDVIGDDTPVVHADISGFDAALIVNQFTAGPRTLFQKWDWLAANNWSQSDQYGSYSTDGVNWTLPSQPWAIENTWHTPGEYQAGWFLGNPAPKFVYGGMLYSDDQGVEFPAMYQGVPVSGLMLTFRIVHPYAPDEIDWSIHNFYGGSSGTVLGPGPAPPEPPPGSFDGDYDVDDIDIDMLCDFIRNSMPYDLLYDISGDGVTGGTDGFVDTLDLDYLIRFLVETSLGKGTEYGDFNLDGVIDTTDLTRLATNYGADDWKWDDGNANRHLDTDIDNTDLTILATYYGFGEPDLVPEPMTLSILALGAAGLLRRRPVHR